MNHDNIKLDLVDFDYDGDTVIGDYTVTIATDIEPANPREWDNLGRMVCWHRGYNLGDDHGYETPDVFMHVLSGLYSEEATEFLTKEQRNRVYEVAATKAIILPLYLYDHSGITMRSEPFSCAWDSGMVGYIYVTLADVREEHSAWRVSQKLYNRVLKSLEAEVEQFDQYLTGDVYGFNIVKDVDGEEVDVDSCWGFYGQDGYMLDEIRSIIAYDINDTPQQLEMNAV